MSDITITLPLSVLGEAENLSPRAILAAFQQATDQREEIKKLVKVIQSAGEHLISVLDTLDGLEKATALRKLATDMKGYGK